MAVIGVDGCRAGWFAVRIEGGDDGECGAEVFPTVAGLLASPWGDASLILIDIPIGLPDSRGERACDKEARARLGPRASSVFPAPGREALEADRLARRHEAVSEANRRETGRGLSIQAFGIVPKIREVDDLMRERGPAARPAIREIHPEVCFWALHGKRPMAHNKGGAPGQRERLAVLRALRPDADGVYAEALRRFMRKDVARDDILDALAAALTAVPAERRGAALPTLPADPPRDALGLPMEMVYREA